MQEERESLLRELHAELDSERKLFEKRKPAMLEEASQENHAPPPLSSPKPRSPHYGESFIRQQFDITAEGDRELKLGSRPCCRCFGGMDVQPISFFCLLLKLCVCTTSYLTRSVPIRRCLFQAHRSARKEQALFLKKQEHELRTVLARCEKRKRG